MTRSFFNVHILHLKKGYFMKPDIFQCILEYFLFQWLNTFVRYNEDFTHEIFAMILEPTNSEDQGTKNHLLGGFTRTKTNNESFKMRKQRRFRKSDIARISPTRFSEDLRTNKYRGSGNQEITYLVVSQEGRQIARISKWGNIEDFESPI